MFSEFFKTKNLIINTLFGIIFFFILSLFFSYQKLYIALIISLILIIFKINIKKIILYNLIIFSILLKLIFTFYNPNDYYTILSKTIYEKHFLVGVKNLNMDTEIYGGNMDPNNKNNIRSINIKTDNLGYRNNIDFNNAEYVLIGDSLFHNHRIDQENLINIQLNSKSEQKFYNASLTGTDMGHYFETIKFFKNLNKDKKYIMIIFPGNDFLSYESTQKNYSMKLGNRVLKNYFELKEFFDFYTRIKFITNLLKKQKLEQRIDKSQTINGENIFFYKRYYVKPNININFSDEFNIYKEFSPDILIIVPSKAQVYCEYIDDYDCYDFDFEEKLSNISLFQNTKILDSTNYFKTEAQKKLLSNNFIFFKDDTHLNEDGLSLFSDFIIQNIN